MRVRWVAGAVLLAATVVSGQVRHPLPLPDPAQNLVRIELRLVTDARFASVRILEPLLARGEGQRLSGPDALRTVVQGSVLSLSGNDGRAAAAVFRLVLAQVAPESSIRWQLDVEPGHRATFEIANANDQSSPRLVDRFEGAAGETFVTAAAPVRINGPLAPPGPPAERLVLGFYFPWYERETWSDPQMLGRPLRAYSTDDAGDVLEGMRDAARAGLDGVIVSFQGKDTGGGWNHRRMLLVLQAARQTGLRVSVQIETLAAHLPDRPGPPHGDTLTAWLTDIVDLYGSHPAYLRVDGRPAVFVYVWPVVSDDTWLQVLTRVRAGGRPLFVLADTTNTAALRLADAVYTFSGTLFSPDIRAFTRQQSLAARTYHLGAPDRGGQRLGIATVTPGYDETRLRDRPERRVVDRQGGSFYQSQWVAATNGGADWVLVMTWNEWWENTHIEPSQEFGEDYLRRTRFWSTAFKDLPRAGHE